MKKSKKEKDDAYNKFRARTRPLNHIGKQILFPIFVGIITLIIQVAYDTIESRDELPNKSNVIDTVRVNHTNPLDSLKSRVQSFDTGRSLFQAPSKSELLWSILFTFVSLIYVVAKERAQEISEHSDILRLYEIINPHDWLIKAHCNLPNKLGSFLSQKLDYSAHRGGGIVVLHVDDRRYLEWLKECLDNASESYESILVDPYDPKWFFDMRSGMDPKLKQKFLEVVETHPNRSLIKKRIMIFERAKLTAFFNLMSNEEIKKFFEWHQSVQLLYLDMDRLNQAGDWYHDFRQAIRHDYALVDKKLVLKRNGDLELSFCIGKTEEFQAIFDESQHRIHEDLIITKDELINQFNLQLKLS